MVDMTVKNVAKAKEEPNMDVLYHFSSAGWFHMGYNSVVSLLQDGHMTIGQLGFNIQEKNSKFMYICQIIFLFDPNAVYRYR